MTAKPVQPPNQLRAAYEEPDLVGDIDGQRIRLPRRYRIPFWIADWTFDASGGACDFTGWTNVDNHIAVTDGGAHHWSVKASFSGVGNVVGEAAILGKHNLCWVIPDGYDNDWYSGIRIEYTGDSFLSFDYLVDSEGRFWFSASGGRLGLRFVRA